MTVYGDDYFGEILEKECKENNISLNYAERITNTRSSTYLYVADNRGDLVTGINDMKIVDHITPEFLSKRIEFINNAAICVIDANIPQKSIEWLASHCTIPIFVDPVSVAKVKRFENVLDKIDTFKPNEAEAESLTGISVVDEKSGAASAKILNEKGVKNVFISLGEQGILCSRDRKIGMVPTLPTRIVNTNGAGDCTMATIIWARYYYGDVLPLTEIGLFTQAAASLTLESYSAVSPDLNIRNIIKKAKKYNEESVKDD